MTEENSTKISGCYFEAEVDGHNFVEIYSGEDMVYAFNRESEYRLLRWPDGEPRPMVRAHGETEWKDEDPKDPYQRFLVGVSEDGE